MAQRMYYLLALETASIQSYIFGSNRLKENVGASYLVAAATGQWALDAIRELTDAHNLTDDDSYDDTQRIEANTAQAVEVLYYGGGNFVALFADESLCRDFCQNLSRRVIVEAPGLQVVFHTEEYRWSTPLSDVLDNLPFKFRQQRGYQPLRRGIAGLGVTAECQSSNLPAITLEDDPDNDDTYVLYSAEAASKHAAADFANTQLQKQFENLDDYTFALEIDKLGSSKGERSTIAVVHADGNGLGKFIKQMQGHFSKAKDNRELIVRSRMISEKIKQVNRLCQQALADQLLASIEVKGDQYSISGIYDEADIQLERTTSGVIFPLRPLVSGGDDITFVCDGRIAIDLTMTFLAAFEYYTAKLLGNLLSETGLKHLTACAGIAIVNTHYPFARAYALADELATSAKEARHTEEIASSAFDWHFTNGGIYGGLDEMRRREYHVEYDEGRYGSLTLRPLFIASDDDDNDAPPYRTWAQIQRLTVEFQTAWRNHRSKAKGLMNALREGSLETQIYDLRHLRDDGLALPAFARFHEQYGWDADVCGYYDALELMDLYIPLHTIEVDPA